MAAYTLTPANSEPGNTTVKFLYGTFGEAVSAGQPCCYSPTYRDDRGGYRIMLADANNANRIPCIGIAACTGTDGTPAQVITYDEFYTHGLTGVTAGDVIIVGATAGALHPASDLASGWYPMVCILAGSSTTGKVDLLNGTVAKA